MFGLSEATIALMTGYIVKIVGVLIALFIANLVAGWVGGLVSSRLTRVKFDATLTRFFGKLTRWAILVMAVLACLGVFGIETTSFAAVIGAAGLAVGLAFQGTLGNFSAGIMLLVFRPFKVGDVISAAGVVGGVQEIDLFTTTLDTPDNRRLIVPNGSLFGATIENITHHPVRRCDVPVGVAYGADIDATRAALARAAASISVQAEGRDPQIFLVGLGASSVDWQVRVWCPTARFWDAHQQTVQAIKRELDAAGIGIPYNTVDVNVAASAELAAMLKR